MPPDLTEIPTWVGEGIFGVILLVFGYFLKEITSRLKKVRAGKERTVSQLKILKHLLDESKLVFVEQCTLRNKLYNELKEKYGENEIKMLFREGYDEGFFLAYDRMDDKQHETFVLIRGMTNRISDINKKLLDWGDENRSIVELIKQQKGISSLNISHLEADLFLLRGHLIEWFNKYENIFKPNERRSLVYLGDEKEHGIPFPNDLDNDLTEVLEEMSK